jgi:hypothetical protein
MSSHQKTPSEIMSEKSAEMTPSEIPLEDALGTLHALAGTFRPPGTDLTRLATAADGLEQTESADPKMPVNDAFGTLRALASAFLPIRICPRWRPRPMGVRQRRPPAMHRLKHAIGY